MFQGTSFHPEITDKMTVQQVFHPSVVTEVIHYDGDDVRLGLAQHQLGPGEEKQQLPNHVGRDCDLVS